MFFASWFCTNLKHQPCFSWFIYCARQENEWLIMVIFHEIWRDHISLFLSSFISRRLKNIECMREERERERERDVAEHYRRWTFSSIYRDNNRILMRDYAYHYSRIPYEESFNKIDTTLGCSWFATLDLYHAHIFRNMFLIYKKFSRII